MTRITSQRTKTASFSILFASMLLLLHESDARAQAQWIRPAIELFKKASSAVASGATALSTAVSIANAICSGYEGNTSNASGTMLALCRRAGANKNDLSAQLNIINALKTITERDTSLRDFCNGISQSEKDALLKQLSSKDKSTCNGGLVRFEIFELVGVKPHNCSDAKFQLKDMADGNVYDIVLRDADGINACSINLTADNKEIAKSVARFVGLTGNMQFAFLSSKGDCSQRTFEIVDKNSGERVPQVLQDNCKKINFSLGPTKVAAQVATYFNL